MAARGKPSSCPGYQTATLTPPQRDLDMMHTHETRKENRANE
jgi:hypothetical protein